MKIDECLLKPVCDPSVQQSNTDSDKENQSQLRQHSDSSQSQLRQHSDSQSQMRQHASTVFSQTAHDSQGNIIILFLLITL